MFVSELFKGMDTIYGVDGGVDGGVGENVVHHDKQNEEKDWIRMKWRRME